MDCKHIGRLIYSLRKEKRMTQHQLAEKLNISNKAVSKWERGLGCPDVSLLGELSDILGVNIESILSGDLRANDADGGNMKKLKFYICSSCGNILTATSEAEITCCGRKINPSPSQASENDDSHQITVEAIEDEYYIKLNHEMTKEHYISFVAYSSYDRILLIRLYPEQSAELWLPKMRSGKLYFYCNRHGLWEKSIASVARNGKNK